MMQNLDASLLASFMTGDESAAEQFKLLATPHILAFARRFGKKLPVDIIGEIPNATFTLLLEGTGNLFDPARADGNIPAFLYGVVRTATQRVRASYAPPTKRTRYYKDDPAEHREIIALDELPRAPADERAAREFAVFEAAYDVEALLAGASATVVAALIAIYLHNRKVKDVARQLGVSRFRLHRDIEAFRRQCCRRPARSLAISLELAT